MEELIQAFSVEGMSKSPAIFDVNKLTWMNAEYIRRLSPAEFTAHALPYYEKAGVAGMDHAVLSRILQPRTEVFTQIPDMVDFLAQLDETYSPELFTNKKSKTNPEVAKAVLSLVIPALSALPDWTEESIHGLLLGMAAGAALGAVGTMAMAQNQRQVKRIARKLAKGAERAMSQLDTMVTDLVERRMDL